ncbi:MAG: hypothetical protein IJS14_04875 [Lentisphaeria bacterium]|nr:hypothetical protein [Lentisphaeria bacterium]
MQKPDPVSCAFRAASMQCRITAAKGERRSISRTFSLEKNWKNGRLRIDGMGLRGSFFLDGRPLGTCVLPYSAFELETGTMTAGDHRITALIDNNFDAEKMKLFLPYYDFYAFGGFYHGVSLRLSDEENPLDRIRIRTADCKTGKLNLEFIFRHGTPPKIAAVISINSEPAQTVEIRNGLLDLERPDLPLWSPDSPAVHTLTVTIGGDTVTETFGIREIRAEGKKILLNGKPVFLKGFNRHESWPVSGAATTQQQMLTDLQHLKSLHANFIRGAHYPQSQKFLDLCDRMGFLVWEESLGWGNKEAQMQDAEFIGQQVEQTRLMVHNSFNHPSVIIFGFLNENFSGTDAGVDLCRKLAETIREEQPGRLVTFACSHNFKDRALEYMDIATFNTYPGWIDTDSPIDPLEKIAPNQKDILTRFREVYGEDKPILVSEIGCCALYGQHDEAAAQWSEEFQAGYLAKVIDTVTASPEIAGLTIWQMNDAKSSFRTGTVIRSRPLAQNLGGIYDQYRRPKLAAATVADKFAKIK